MTLHALFLNCTLKRSPETSNTQAFARLDGMYADGAPVSNDA